MELLKKGILREKKENFKNTLTKGVEKHIMHNNFIVMETVEAEITLQAHSQRVRAGASRAESGAANGPPRAWGKAKAEYSMT